LVLAAIKRLRMRPKKGNPLTPGLMPWPVVKTRDTRLKCVEQGVDAPALAVGDQLFDITLRTLQSLSASVLSLLIDIMPELPKPTFNFEAPLEAQHMSSEHTQARLDEFRQIL
jgi:hypothetical protein